MHDNKSFVVIVVVVVVVFFFRQRKSYIFAESKENACILNTENTVTFCGFYILSTSHNRMMLEPFERIQMRGFNIRVLVINSNCMFHN